MMALMLKGQKRQGSREAGEQGGSRGRGAEGENLIQNPKSKIQNGIRLMQQIAVSEKDSRYSLSHQGYRMFLDLECSSVHSIQSVLVNRD